MEIKITVDSAHLLELAIQEAKGQLYGRDWVITGYLQDNCAWLTVEKAIPPASQQKAE